MAHRLQHPTSPPSYSSVDLGRPAFVNTKLDVPQRLENKLAKFNASRNVFKRWFFEISAWVVSALCLCAIVTTYVIVKERPLAELGSVLAITNILGKVATAALIIPTTEALGQLKWNWFNTSNAIWDFEIFDKATRGPWGAAMLLYRTKGRSLASLGAIIILLLLAIDSFLQQTIDLPERWALQKASGRLRRTIRYQNTQRDLYSDGLLWAEGDRDVILATDRFFYDNGTRPVESGNGTAPEIPISCPTSNCTWPIYETLAVCNQCADVSDYLSFSCINSTNDWTADVRGGYTANATYSTVAMCGFFLNATNQDPVLMSGYILDPETSEPGEVLLVRTLPMLTVFDKVPVFGDGSIRFPDVRNPITDVMIVSSADGSVGSILRHEKPVAQECVLAWCVKTLKSSYDSGLYKEEVLTTHTNTSKGASLWSNVPILTEEVTGVDMFLREGNEIQVDTTLTEDAFANFGLSNDTAYKVMMVFDDIFPSFYTAKTPEDEPWLRFWLWKSGTPYLRRLLHNPWQAPNNVTRHMDRMATVLSNMIRTVGDTETYLDGKAYTREVYVHVRWGWLAFPLVLLVLSLAFLIATIMKTSSDGQTGVWKTSAMPTLIYGLPKETQNHLNSSATWDNTNKEAKHVRVKLSPRMGWRVSGQAFLNRSTLLPLRRNQAPPGWI